MAKLVDDTVLDAALGIIDNADKLTVCKSEPTTYAHATASYMLASVSVSASDFAIANGSSGGRKVTITSQNSVSVTTTGAAQRICLVSTASSILLYKTECSAQSISSGNKVNIGSWKITINDPT